MTPADCPDEQRIDCALQFQATGARLDGLTAQQQSNSTKLDAIHLAIVGDSDRIGLAGRVRQIEAAIAERARADERRSTLLRGLAMAVAVLLINAAARWIGLTPK